MIRYLKAIFAWFLLLRSFHAIQLPPSPCPNVFAYEGDAESDRWHGVITFSSNIELVGMNYKVQLDRPSQLLVSWDGEVRSEDNTNYNVFDPYHTQRAGEIVKARIMVKFNPNNGIPGILRIVINGNTMCSRDGNFGSGIGIGLSGESTTRFDPTFNEGDDSASEFSGNRGQSSSSNYGGNSPNYNENGPSYESRPISNRPSYGSGESGYSGSNGPNYNGAGSSSNSNPPRHVPNYVNSAATSSSVFVVNPSNTGDSSNSGSYVPSRESSNNYNGNRGGGSSSGTFPSQSSYNNNPEYSSGNRPQQQWSETPSSGTYGNRTSSGSNWQNNDLASGQSIGSTDLGANGGPIVTTLTLPNNSVPNKTNIDQIVQIIKNQLEQQQISPTSNKTVIVAVVNPVPSISPQTGANATTSPPTTTDSSVVYRTTTTPTTAVTTKAKIVVSTAKSSSSNGHTSRP